MNDNNITRLLQQWRQGNEGARDQLFSAVYEDLRKSAKRMFGRERPGHTLQPTALVNEACIRFLGEKSVSWRNRTEFFAAAAVKMYEILVDHARSRGSMKRGGNVYKISFSGIELPADPISIDLLELAQALGRLEEVDSRLCKVVVLRFLAGFTVRELCGVLQISAATVKRDWSLARAFLHRELFGDRR